MHADISVSVTAAHGSVRPATNMAQHAQSSTASHFLGCRTYSSCSTKVAVFLWYCRGVFPVGSGSRIRRAHLLGYTTRSENRRMFLYLFTLYRDSFFFGLGDEEKGGTLLVTKLIETKRVSRCRSNKTQKTHDLFRDSFCHRAFNGVHVTA